MKKSEIMKAFLAIAEQLGGEVTNASIYDSWVSVKVVADDGAEYSLDFNVLKEAKTDGN